MTPLRIALVVQGRFHAFDLCLRLTDALCLRHFEMAGAEHAQLRLGHSRGAVDPK